MDKITILAQERFQNEFPKKAESEVEITTAAGHIFSSGVMSARWDLNTTLPTDQELEDKFLWLVSPVLGKSNATALKKMVMHFDREKNLDKLIGLCTDQKEE